MINAQEMKFVNVTSPVSDTNAVATTSIDTKGYDFLTVVCMVGDIQSDMTALALQESDTDGSYSNVTGLVYGTSNALSGSVSTLPTAASDDDTLRIFEYDLRTAKRYINIDATAAGTTLIGILGILSRSEGGQNTASLRGVEEILRA